MPTKRYRAAAHFPSLDDDHKFQTVVVESNSWSSALAKIGRALKALPVMRRRRIRSFALSVTEAGHALSEAPSEQLPLGNAPATSGEKLEQS